MTISFNQALGNAKQLLHTNVNNLNSVLISAVNSNVDLINTLLQHILQAKSKQFRPILTMLSAGLFSNVSNSVVNIAAAVEFIHTATLLHDDVIDETKLRRGKPTANNIWGNKESILVGDFLFAKAFELMVSCNNINVLQVLAQASSTITKGEVLQLEQIGNINLPYNTYINIIGSKTGALFAAACKSGAMLTNNNVNNHNNLYNYGYNLGVAFQIVDDILDYTANETQSGKKIGTDLLEQKITLPIILLLQQANATEQNIIKQAFSQLTLQQQSLSQTQIHNTILNQTLPQLLNLMQKYNIINNCKTIVNTFVEDSLQNLHNLQNVTNHNYLSTLQTFAKSTFVRNS